MKGQTVEAIIRATLMGELEKANVTLNLILQELRKSNQAR